jgi:Na+-driven multidrug efflux pump
MWFDILTGCLVWLVIGGIVAFSASLIDKNENVNSVFHIVALILAITVLWPVIIYWFIRNWIRHIKNKPAEG